VRWLGSAVLVALAGSGAPPVLAEDCPAERAVYELASDEGRLKVPHILRIGDVLKRRNCLDLKHCGQNLQVKCTIVRWA